MRRYSLMKLIATHTEAIFISLPPLINNEATDQK